MKIYTKSGDAGQTSLFGGKRVSKDDTRLEAYGSIDELNSVLGIVQLYVTDTLTNQIIRYLQNTLFVAGGDLASPDTDGEGSINIQRISANNTLQLEKYIDEIDAQLLELRAFILPGGSMASAYLHLARTVCRRAERLIIALANKEHINQELTIFVNRLSDLLFVMARWENSKSGIADVLWEK